MADYKHQDELALLWGEYRTRLRTEGTIVLRRVMNDVLEEAKKQFNREVMEGGVPEVRIDKAAIRQLFLSKAYDVLRPTDD